MKAIFKSIFYFIHLPFPKEVVLNVGGDEIRRIRMVSYISLISMLTMLLYIMVYAIIDVNLFKPAIIWLLFGDLLCIVTLLANKVGKHVFAKYLLVLINPIFMAGAATKIFGHTPQFQTFLLISVYIPLFLWSLRKNLVEIVVFISLSVALYIYIEFFIMPLDVLVVLPTELAVGFQKTNVVVCFAAAGLAFTVFMILAYRKEDKLVLKTLELEQTQKHRDTIYSIIAHDLRSPFNGLVGISDLLLKSYNEFSDEKKKELLSTMHHSAVSLNTLLENLLGWTKMQSGKLQPNFETVQVNDTINGIAELFQSALDKKQIAFNSTVPNNLKVHADKYMFSTIVRNLINNAIKFTPTKGSIQLHAKQINEQIELSIADNGIGIPSDEIDSIFNPESDYVQKGTQDEKGSGLGLKLCSDFVTAMGGQIWAESELGKGSRFYIKLQLA